MYRFRSLTGRALLGLILALACVGLPAAAQTLTGNLYGKVVDESGVALPGVAVTLSGPGAAVTLPSTSGGEFRFLNLPPGEYTVTAVLSGFATVARSGVRVGVKNNAELTLSMRLSTRAETVEVKAEAPILDTRKTSSGANVTQVELQSIPTARDPWVILQSVPGVLTDRVNVGGSESGQQSIYVGKGSIQTQNTWNVDGVNITDMAALGSSPTYWNFDSFEETQVATGGTDPSVGTPGVQLNVVTKRGSNAPHGSARVFITDHRWQATNIPDELSNQLLAGSLPAAGNSVDGLQDYGADIGGAAVKDRLWLWAAYGRNQIDLITAGGLSDKTTLENINGKVNAQITANNSATLFYQRGDKLKFGRNAGLTRPQETTWNQTGPTMVYKAEDSHIFGESFFASAAGSYVDASLNLKPPGSGQVFVDSNDVFHNSYASDINLRPQKQFNANASYFFRTAALSHELKVGGVYRDVKSTRDYGWPGGIVACGPGSGSGTPCPLVPVATVNFTRDLVQATKVFQYSGFVSDTITVPHLTINVGLRYDNQSGKNLSVSAPGTAGASLAPAGTVLPPAVSATESTPGFRWTDWQPRIGLTYAIGSDQKTLARASYARFADQIGTGNISPYSVVPGNAYIYYGWNDTNHNNRVDAGEVDTSQGNFGFFGFDPANPGGTGTSINGVNANLKAPKTDEISLGFDREIMPTLAVSVLGTYRNYSDLVDATSNHAFGVTKADYVIDPTLARTGVLPDGTAYNVPVYRLRTGVAASPGQFQDNNPTRHQTYVGVELQANKRYADNWMARLSLSYNDWKDHLGDNGFFNPNGFFFTDGDLAAIAAGGTSGPRQSVYINSKWQANLSAMYSLPVGFNISGNFFARQGYPINYLRSWTIPGSLPTYAKSGFLSVTPVDAYRYPTVSDLDLGLSKIIKISAVDFTLSVDVFNVLNRNTVLQRNNILLQGTTNQIREVQAPRVARFGMRASF